MFPITARLLIALTGLSALAACSTPQTEDYAGRGPAFDIRDYMKGDIAARGMFVSRAGEADPMFHVDLQGYWNDGEGLLTEHFTYDDGHTQDRAWHLHFIDDHHFTGTAPDVVGAAQGTQYGNAVDMVYVLKVTTKDGDSYNMDMDDWLYRLDDHTVINRNEMSKFGIKAGELIISFDKK